MSQLESPLLDSPSIFLEGTTNGKDFGDEIDPINHRESISSPYSPRYSEVAPRILLETLSGRTCTLVLLTTWLAFVICFVLDVKGTLASFDGGKHVLSASPCESAEQYNPSSTGCTSLASQSWNGSLLQLSNIVSVGLNVYTDNITAVQEKYIEYNATTIALEYSASIWACYLPSGCGTDFTYDPQNNALSTWKLVLTKSSQQILIDLPTLATTNITLIPNTFQNQEALPTRGNIHSYFFIVKYLNDDLELFTSRNSLSSTFYEVVVVSRSTNMFTETTPLVLLVVIVFTTVGYICNLATSKKKTLSEQRWVILYLIALIFYTNPVYVILLWTSADQSAERVLSSSAVYVSYIFDAVGQALLFVVWLLFADSIHRKVQSFWRYYTPKLLFGIIYLLFAVVILTFQFPSIDSTSSQSRGAVEAAAEWPRSAQTTLITFTLGFLILQWGWVLGWFITLWRSGCLLSVLPYMGTRYLQLSFRFFSLQASLVVTYYVFQYALVIYFLDSVTGTNLSRETLSDNINTVLRTGIQTAGRDIFLTFYGLTLSFLFLQADSNISKSTLASMYAISADDMHRIVKFRRSKIQSFGLAGVNHLLVACNAEVYCIDIALDLCNLSFDAYYDPIGIQTPSGFRSKNMDLGVFGYDLIDVIYNKDHDTFAFICKHRRSKTLVVGFRGTSSRRHWSDNLNFTKMELNLQTIGGLETLNEIDGLSISNQAIEEDASVNDCDSDKSMFSDFADDASTPRLSRGMRETFHSVKTAAHSVVEAMGATTDYVVGAASNTPVLKGIVRPHVHSGFWSAYSVVRVFIHGVLRRELSTEEVTHVYFTGHSLGGALATLAAMDVQINTIPRVRGMNVMNFEYFLLIVQLTLTHIPCFNFILQISSRRPMKIRK